MRVYFYITGLLFLLITSFSCKQASKGAIPYHQLKGHWHITPTNQTETGYSTIDFENDSLAILNKHHQYGGTLCFLNKKANELNCGGECLIGDFILNWVNSNHIELIQSSLGDTLSAVLTNQCNKQDEYFGSKKLMIELPYFKGEPVNKNTINSRFESSIYIGRPKPRYRDKLGSEFRFSLDDDIATFKDISLWEEANKLSIPSAYQDSSYYAIYADKNTPLIQLHALIEQLKIDKHAVFIAFNKAQKHDAFEIQLYQLQSNDFSKIRNNKGMLESFLNK